MHFYNSGLVIANATLPLRLQGKPSMSAGGQIDNVMQEARLFPPTREFSQRAVIKSQEQYQRLYDAAAKDPEKFWGDLAREELHWFPPFGKALEWKEPFAKWFVGGKSNASYNCL